jgi:hypothetical protein
MGKRISSQTRKELLEAIQQRYRESSKIDKTRILDEFVALTGYHRKHGVRLLNEPCDTESKTVQDGCVRCRRVYDEAIKETLTVIGLPQFLVPVAMRVFYIHSGCLE